MERKHVGRRKCPPNSSSPIPIPIPPIPIQIPPISTPIPIPKTPNHSFSYKRHKLDDSSSSSSSSSSISNQIMLANPSSSSTSSKSPDLPCSILIEILGRLPIKSLISCKFVCKSWRSLLTESYFYRLYTLHMPTSLILQNKGSSITTLKQIHYIESSSKPNPKPNPDPNPDPNHNGLDPDCKKNNGLEPDCTENSSMMKKLRFVRRINSERNNDLGYLNGPDFRFELGNSCNGFVCVCDSVTREPTLVWNPMMGQFAVLPKPATTLPTTSVVVDRVVAGFGLCGRTGRYKVLRISHRNLDPQFRLGVEIYELGVGENWRVIGDAPFPIPSKIPGFYTHNSIHWIMEDEFHDPGLSLGLICGFDFIEERFKVVTAPPIYSPNERNKYHWSNLGMIASHLSICAIDAKIFRADVQVWVMEEYGVPESWNLRLSIRDPTVDWWDPHRWMQVTNFGNDKDSTGNGSGGGDDEILMLCAHSYLLAYSVRDRDFSSVEGLKFTAIALAPSLISLEDVLCEEQGTGSLSVRYL